MNEPTLTLEELRQQLDIFASNQEPTTRTDVIELKIETHFNTRKINFINQREEAIDKDICKLEDDTENLTHDIPSCLLNFLDLVKYHDR
jgi:hypothetical protein|tara:strand:+ start:231 stop:497 length:267 start_codon:yes stop_codon:yes gene_type:complete